MPTTPNPLIASLQKALDQRRIPDFWDEGLSQGGDFHTYGPVQDFTNEGSSWDKLKLAGMDVPGICEVRGSKGRKIHKKDAPAQNGAQLTHLGYRPAEVTIKVVMWTPDHLEAWTELILNLFPSVEDTNTVEAVDVDHPSLRLHGITSLYVEDIAPLYPGHVRGTMETVLRLTEFKDVVKAKTGNVKLSSNTGGVSTVPQASSTQAAAQDPNLVDSAP